MQPSLMSVGPVRVCCPFDPAIDRDKSQLARYAYERKPDLIVEREGRRVTWFHLQRLSRKRVLEVDQVATNEKAALIAVFRDAVLQVDNMPRLDGSVDDVWLPSWRTQEPSSVTHRRLSEEELELFTREEIYDIGQAAWVISNLRPGRPIYCRPLDTSVLAMAATGYHHADESPIGASPDNESASREQTETAPTPS